MKTDSAYRGEHGRKFVDARLRYQFFVFITCLIASICFWLLIKMSNEYTLTYKIPVKFINVPNTRMLTEISDSSIQIALKAQGFKLLRLRYVDNPTPLFISLANSVTHKNIDEISSSQILMPLVRRYSSLLGFTNEVRSVHPEQITVKLNRLYSKSVPVKPLTDISFAPQYLQFDSSAIRPSNVTVYGTRAMVDSVAFAQPGVIKIHNMTYSMVRFVHLNSNTQKNKPYFIPSRVQVAIPVEKFTEVSVQVPVKLPNQTPGNTIKIFPDKVLVSCIISMKDYKKLDSRLFTVSAVLMKSDNLFHLKVTSAPDFVRNVKVSPDKVEYLVLR